MPSARAWSTLSELTYLLLVALIACVAGLTCVALMSQAVRTSPHQNWTRNFNALIIGAGYTIVLLASIVLCFNRRFAVRRRLQRISKVHRLLDRRDVPKAVHDFISQEYVRACMVVFESQPKDVHHEGWGRPGTQYEGIQFRHALLGTVPEVDALAHSLIPHMESLKPNARMLYHFKYLIPLLSQDEDGLTALHYWDSIIELARNSSKEPTEEDYELGMNMVSQIFENLEGLREELELGGMPAQSDGHAPEAIPG